MLATLDQLIEYIWICDFGILCAFAIHGLKLRVASSSLLTQTIVLIFTGSMIQYQELVNSFTEPRISNFSFIWWCIGFVLLDCIMILGIYVFYQKVKTYLSALLKTLLLALAFLQFGCALADISKIEHLSNIDKTSEQVDPNDAPSMTPLDDSPFYGDLSDQGAVDVALKIMDLRGFEEDAKDKFEFAFYRQQLLEQCHLLVNLTLTQVQPQIEPEHDLYSDPYTMPTPPPNNVIPFGKAKAQKNRNAD